MGSSRVHESELFPSRERLQSYEELELFLQMRKGEQERMNANANQMPSDTAFHAHDYECFDAGPIEAGSALEAHVAARLSSSSIYRSSKPILRYASKRNNTDLLTYDTGKTDFDWLKTPPATPLDNSFDDATSGNAEGNIVHMLSTASQEFGDKFFPPKTVASLLLDGNKLERASTSNVVTETTDSLGQANHVNNHTKPGISSNLPRSITKTTQSGIMGNHTKGSIKALSKPEGEVSLHGTSGTKNRTNGSHQNPVVPSIKTTKTTTSTSRFCAPTTIKTNMNTTSNSLQNTKTVGPITPKMAVTSNTKQTTITSKGPTTPTLYQNQPESTANGNKPRPTSIGRGAIHASSSNTTKQSKGSRSTSSSRVGSPETKQNPPSLLWDSLEMPEAPPNLRTSIPKRSTSTTRISRQPTTPTYNGSNSSNAGKNTNRSVSASRGRSTSTSRPSVSVSSGTGNVTLTSSKGNNNKGASNGNVLGSKMVDKVVQSRRAAASLSSSSPLVSPSSKSSTLSTHSSASSTLSMPTSKSSSLSVSSPSSVKSVPSVSSVSSSSSFLEFSNKSLIKPGFFNTSSITLDSTLDLTYIRSKQMSKANPVRGNGEIQQLGTSHLQENPCNNANNMRHTVGRSKNTQALKNFNTMAAILMEKKKHEELGHQQFNNTSEELSDFSNELEAIMRQDRGQYYGAFPSKDIIQVNNNWMMNSPDYMRNDSVEFMHLFRQGIDKYGVSESPLVCQHGALGNCDKCNNLSGKGSMGFGEVWKPSPLSGNLSAIHKNPHELWKGSPY